MVDGVFDERLEHLVGHPDVERVGRHVHDHPEPVGEARLLDVQVAAQELELLLQRHFLDADRRQRHAEQVAQLRQHLVGGVGVAVDQRRDRVQRVEQEVRVELPFQHFELRLRQPRLELRGAQLALREAAVVAPRFVHADENPVRQEPEIEVGDRDPLEAERLLVDPAE